MNRYVIDPAYEQTPLVSPIPPPNLHVLKDQKRAVKRRRDDGQERRQSPRNVPQIESFSAISHVTEYAEIQDKLCISVGAVSRLMRRGTWITISLV
jgi:hypothetical protein